jgi:ketosteroid isomerase-like protein
MPESSTELVRRLLELFNGGDREALLAHISEDFVAVIPPSLSAEPDVYEGHAGVLRYLDAFEGMLEEVRFEPLEFHPHGDVVIVDMLLKGRGVASGIEVAQRTAGVHWVEDGRVKRIEPHPDLESAREALRRRGKG